MNFKEHLKNSYLPCDDTKQPTLDEQINSRFPNLSSFGRKAVKNFIVQDDGFLNDMLYNLLLKDDEHGVELTNEQKEFIAKHEKKPNSIKEFLKDPDAKVGNEKFVKLKNRK